MKRFEVVIVGAGRVGLALAARLRDDAFFSVELVDGVLDAVDRAAALGHEAVLCDVMAEPELLAILRRADAVVAAVPERLVSRVAAAAAKLGIHHLDFSDARATGLRRRDATAELPAIYPAAGVAPGLVDDLVADLVARFDTVDDLVVRVGAIPRQRIGRLGYGRIWDMKGLVGEYTRPAEVIVDGEIGHVPALSGYETFDLDGTPLEAFVTADGSSGLAAATAGKVRNACFKTIRHPGHLDYMLFLLDDLGLRSRLDTLTNLLTNGLPQVADDMVVIHIGARGRKAGKKHQEVVVRRIHSTPASGRDPGCGALARGAAAHAAVLLDALRTGHPVEVAAKAPADRFLASVLES